MADKDIKEEIKDKVEDLTAPVSNKLKSILTGKYAKTIAVAVVLYIVYLIFGAASKEQVEEVLNGKDTVATEVVVDSVKICPLTGDTL